MCSSLPEPCIFGAEPLVKGSIVDVRIGITQTPKELEVELADDTDRDALLTQIAEQMEGEGTLTLTDRRGKTVLVPVAKVAYVEVGASATARRVGFGAV